MRRFLILPVVVAASLAIAQPCFACSCVESSDAEDFARADVVFTGVAVSMRDPNEGAEIRSSGDPVHWTFEVSSVEKGTAYRRQEVVTAAGDATCGFSFEVGKRYQVFAHQTEDGLGTGICSGTRALGAGEEPYGTEHHTPAPVPATPVPTVAPTATPSPPPPTPAPSAATATAAPSPTPTPTPLAAPPSDPSEPAGSRSGVLAGASVLGALALGGAGALGWRRIGR